MRSDTVWFIHIFVKSFHAHHCVTVWFIHIFVKSFHTHQNKKYEEKSSIEKYLKIAESHAVQFTFTQVM